MESNFIYGAMTSAGFFGLLGYGIAWIRNLKKDKAMAEKLQAETLAINTSTLGAGYTKLLEGLQEIRTQERGYFEKMMAAERTECDNKIEKIRLDHSMQMNNLMSELNNMKRNMGTR